MRYLAVLILVVLFSVSGVGQEIGPDAPMLIKQGLSVTGVLTPDVSVPATFSFNPAAIAAGMEEWKVSWGAEADYGVISFAEGPTFRSDIQSYAAQGKWGAAKISRYSLSSNTRVARATFGIPASGSADAIELCYGKRISNPWVVGIALVPFDRADIRLVDAGVVLVDGKAEPTLETRLGVLYQPSGPDSVWNFGLTYAYESDRTTVRVSPVLTGLPDWIGLDGRYTTRTITGGVAYRPQLGTTLFAGWQKGDIRGTGLLEDIDLTYYGVEQFLSKQWSMELGSTDRSKDVTVTYYRDPWNVGFSYSSGSSRRLEPWLGRSDMKYVWIGYSKSM